MSPGVMLSIGRADNSTDAFCRRYRWQGKIEWNPGGEEDTLR